MNACASDNASQGNGKHGTFRYLALGDSYTIGESVEEPERWPVQLANRLKAEGVDVAAPEIIARTGWTTDELERGIEKTNPQGPYHLVTLLIGVNNQFRGRSLEQYRQQFSALLDKSVALAGGDKSRVIVLSIPDYSVTVTSGFVDTLAVSREIQQFNEANKEITQDRNIRYVNVTSISQRAKEDLSLLAKDRLHPSGKMYAMWVDLVIEEAKEILDKQN